MHICIYIKGHLVKRKGCIRRNDFVKQGRVVIKKDEYGRVVLNRGWALFKRNNFILTGRARKSSIKEENPQYCEPFRNKVLRFKTSKVNRMNRIIGLWES